MIEIDQIYKADLSSYGEDLQALFINLMGTPLDLKERKLKQLQELEINKKLMKNGIVFLWSEIEILADILKLMDKKNFKYIEHFTIVHLSSKRGLDFLSESEQKTYKQLLKDEQKLKIKEKAKKVDENSDDFIETDHSSDFSNKQQNLTANDFLLSKLYLKKTIKANEFFWNEEDKGFLFKRSKSVLLMFRRVFSYYLFINFILLYYLNINLLLYSLNDNYYSLI